MRRLVFAFVLCATEMLALASSQANELSPQIGNYNIDNLPQLNAQGLTINSVPIVPAPCAVFGSTAGTCVQGTLLSKPAGESTFSLGGGEGVLAHDTTAGGVTDHSGQWNTSFGQLSGQALTIGEGNAFYGGQSGQNDINGSYNSCFGQLSCNSLLGTTDPVGNDGPGSNNSGFGQGSLFGVTRGQGNSAFGVNSGLTINTGFNNICMGANSCNGVLTTGANNIVFGASEDAPAAGASFALNIGHAITGTLGGGTNPTVCAIGMECVLGVLRGANFNITTDQGIQVVPLTPGVVGYLASATKFFITEIDVTNCSTALTTAKGAIYSSFSKGGTIIGAATTAYTNCSSVTTRQRLTGLTNMDTTVFRSADLFANALFLNLTTAQGGAATGDVYVIGVPFN